ncbi:MAG TPA: CvpA family protein [Patescibacteria group bacterium]|nr:CvpA family protein [Patescibacteria group bacterium]
MGTVDIIILIIIALFVIKGIKLGLIEAVGGIIGLFVGAYMAGLYYDEVADMLINLLFGSQILANVLGFLLVFIIVNRVIALLFWIIDKVFHVIAIIPFLKTFNRLLGGLFGLIEGLIFVGIVVFFLSLIPFTGGLQEAVAKSRFAPVMETVGRIADPFIPDTIIDLPFGLDSFDLDALPIDLNSLNLGNIPDDLSDIMDKLSPEDLEKLKNYAD